MREVGWSSFRKLYIMCFFVVVSPYMQLAIQECFTCNFHVDIDYLENS